MSLLFPTYFAEKVTDIDADFLNHSGFKGIILDIDDTLVPHKYPIPSDTIIEWISTLKKNNIKIILVSNNFKKRVSDFAKKLGLPYISMGLKPLSYGITKAIKTSSLSCGEILLVGDQIFTDVLGANLKKIKSLLVSPVSSGKTTLLKIKRFLENPIRHKIMKAVGVIKLNKDNLKG